jgi:hypothetical protein
MQVVPGGVLFCSALGVEFFDGNTITHASGAIDMEILPYMKEQFQASIAAKFDAQRGRYYLMLPNATYILDVAQGGRWYKRSIVARDFAVFPNQLTGPLRIGQLTEPIGNYSNRVQDWAGTQSGIRYVFLGDGQLGLEIDGTVTDWGTLPIVPCWTTVPQETGSVDTVQQFHGLLLRYQGEGAVSIGVPDAQGSYVDVRQNVALPLSVLPTTARITFLQAGVRPSVKLRIESGDLMIHRIQLLAEPTSEIMRSL